MRPDLSGDVFDQVNHVRPATPYRAADDVCLVTTFFNPAGFKSKRSRYAQFAEGIAASGLRLVTIECAFRDAEFELPSSSDTIHVRAAHAMWQKERLINIAVERLPERYRKVIWIDNDVYFENADWAVETSRMLDDHQLVQPFDTVYWLPKGDTEYRGDGLVFRGFAARYAEDPGVVVGGDFQAHGVPGFAWGARRELLSRHGLYDACVIGGADHLLAHAACGDWSSACFGWSLGMESAHHRHFRQWAEAFHEDVRGSVGFVPGALLHLWHGNWENRKYTSRHLALKQYEFDPDEDVRMGESGAWEWTSDKPELHAWAASYFEMRGEDDDPVESLPAGARLL